MCDNELERRYRKMRYNQEHIHPLFRYSLEQLHSVPNSSSGHIVWTEGPTRTIVIWNDPISRNVVPGLDKILIFYNLPLEVYYGFIDFDIPNRKYITLAEICRKYTYYIRRLLPNMNEIEVRMKHLPGGEVFDVYGEDGIDYCLDIGGRYGSY